jgi:hypothetical protein
VEGCLRPYQARGLCHAHYARLKYHNLIPPVEKPPATCTIEGCEKKHFAARLCQAHYRVSRLDVSRSQARDWHHKHKGDDGYVEKARRRRADFREANRELVRLEREKYGRSKDGRFNVAVGAAKRAGRSRSIPKDLYAKFVTESCFYCGAEPGNTYALWLDRVDCSRGYEPDNVVPCCGKCNKLKNNLMTKEETSAVVELLKKMRGGAAWKK